jgi:hypothetical protein
VIPGFEIRDPLRQVARDVSKRRSLLGAEGPARIVRIQGVSDEGLLGRGEQIKMS